MKLGMHRRHHAFGWMVCLVQCVFASTAFSMEIPLLRFSDFFVQPMGEQGLVLSDQLKQANDTDIQIRGYMVQTESGLSMGQFFLAPLPIRMVQHADGDADDLPPATVLVRLPLSQSDWHIPYLSGILTVQGRLKVGRHEETSGRVSWVQLQLDTQATREMSPFEFSRFWSGRVHPH